MSELYNEKRRERRFPINSEVFMSLPDERVIQGLCCNISGSGMLVKSPYSIKVGSSLHLNIREGRINFSAEAKVIRCERHEKSYFLGLQTNKTFD